MVLVLSRTYLAEGTNGKLVCDGQFLCWTIELPWKDNAVGISCIPEGTYSLMKRYSRRFQWHIEVVGVTGRCLILMHPANHALSQLRGCIAPVNQLSGAGSGVQSRLAFAVLKRLVYPAIQRQEDVILIVQSPSFDSAPEEQDEKKK